MSKITVAFIKAAMVYFVLAMLLGLHLSRHGAVYPTLPIHVHFNLLGWMSMMIYGVAYHILPRFSGRALWSDRLAVWHLWLANIGLVGMALGWLASKALLGLFSLVEGVAIVFFVVNMFKTIRAAPPPPPRPAPSPAPPPAPKPPPEGSKPARGSTRKKKK